MSIESILFAIAISFFLSAAFTILLFIFREYFERKKEKRDLLLLEGIGETNKANKVKPLNTKE